VENKSTKEVEEIGIINKLDYKSRTTRNISRVDVSDIIMQVGKLYFLIYVMIFQEYYQ